MRACVSGRLFFVGAVASLLLTACGGGGGSGDSGGGSPGGQTLYVSLNYPGAHLNLFSAVEVQPVLGGFEGHRPNCRLLGGTVPPGMALQDDCRLSGRPTLVGSYSFNLRVGASGVSNTIDTGVSVSVDGPGAFYPQRSAYLSGLVVGAVVKDTPSISNWLAPADLALGWRFALASGSLPPGLSLDAATGAVSGTVGATGSYYATVQATLSTPAGSYQLPISNYSANVSVPTFAYANLGGTGNSVLGNLAAYRTQAFGLTPVVSPGAPSGAALQNFRLQAGDSLPAGLSLDPATGVISGVPTSVSGGTTRLTVLGDINSGVAVTTSSAQLAIDVVNPVNLYYLSPAARRGVALSVAPVVTVTSPVALVNPAYVFTPRSGSCSLPDGMALDPATGVLAGTPAVTGSFLCTVDVAGSNNGVGFGAVASLFVVVGL